MVDPRPEALEISTEQLWDFRILRRCCQFHLFLGRFHSFHSPLSGLDLLLFLPSPSISNTEKGPKDSFRSIKLPSKSSSMGCKFLANVFIHMFSLLVFPSPAIPQQPPAIPPSPGPSFRARESSPIASPCGRASPHGARSVLPAAATAAPCGRSGTWWAGLGVAYTWRRFRKVGWFFGIFFGSMIQFIIPALGTSYDNLVGKQRYEFQRQDWLESFSLFKEAATGNP